MYVELDRGFVPDAMRADFEEGFLFQKPLDVIRAYHLSDVEKAFERIEAAQRAGHWLAGSFSYEFGHVFEPVLHKFLPENPQTPLLELGIYDMPHQKGEKAARKDTQEWDVGLETQIGFETYKEKFNQLQAYIAQGDIYQANLTFPISAMLKGSPKEYYDALAYYQPVLYGAYVERLDGSAILSRSPELFFEITDGHKIEVRPMKGTAKRDADFQKDRAAKNWLAMSHKNQAENLMIVDLLRNDLSRISEIGSVTTSKLFEIESYKTVHQMTSTIQAQLKKHVRLRDILRGLFPCGSITGAPKIRAMEVIHELEMRERGVYCGSIGWLAPNGRACFNVAIRTIELDAEGEGALSVGGGIVFDSQARDEFEEALLKAQFALGSRMDGCKIL